MITLNVDLKQKTEDFYNKFFSMEAKAGKKEILGYCLDKAWADATQRERFMGQRSEIINNKEKIKNALRTEIESRKFSADYDTWHNNMCNNNEHGMKYGIWQKFINMTFKYMYCFKQQHKDEDSDFSDIDFTNCHCPIDSVIAQRAVTLCIVCGTKPSEEIVSIARNGKTNWNNMELRDYENVRKNIQDIIKEFKINNSDTRNPTELEFDFLFW